MIRFSVIIVNFNGGAYLQGALDSLKRQTRRDFEVFVVDNASSDGSMDGLDTSGLPHVDMMLEAENHGFARGNNLAAKKAQGEWIVLLNPDAEAAPDWLDQIAAAAERHPATVMFASAQFDLHNPDRLDGAGDAYLAFGIPWRGGFGRPASDLPGEGSCFSPCGAGAVYRRDAYEAQDGFDERFFCFCEDVDLAFRMRLEGQDCVFLPTAVIHHAGGGLSGRASDFSVRHGARNRIWTYAKNMPPLALLLTLPGHVALTFAILLRGLSTGRFGATLAGIREALAGLGPILQSRRQVQARRTVSSLKVLSAMAWNPLDMLAFKPMVRPLSRAGQRPDPSR